MSELELPQLVAADGLVGVSTFKASLDKSQPFTSNAKGGLVFKLAVEHAFNDVAWPVQQLTGQWFWVAVLVPEGRPSVVDTVSFAKWEASLDAEGSV
jgi:hypothetical protein